MTLKYFDKPFFTKPTSTQFKKRIGVDNIVEGKPKAFNGFKVLPRPIITVKKVGN